MKRFLICAFSVVMALLTTLMGGCSCSGCVENFPLSFTNSFLGGGIYDAPSNYYEELTYSVKNENSYNNDLEKSSELKDDIIKYSYDGTYKTIFSSDSKYPLPTEVESNLESESDSLYYLKTELRLTSTYTVNGTYAQGYINQSTENGNVNYEEEVISEVWFLQKGKSFAPIYSRTSQKNTCVYFSDGKADVKLVETASSITYNKNKYKLSKTVGGETFSESHSYSYKIAVDNNQLLFVIRNIELDKDETFSLPTVTPSYKSPQKLIVKNQSEDTRSFKINNEDKSVPVKNISFSRNDTFNKGPSHYVVLQKSQTNGLEYKSYMLQYAAPLIAYNSFSSMGALVYTLTDINHQGI